MVIVVVRRSNNKSISDTSQKAENRSKSDDNIDQNSIRAEHDNNIDKIRK